jgi:hypothetical protein
MSKIVRTVCTTGNNTECNCYVMNLFQTLWRSEIRINLEVYTDASVAFVSGVQYIISMKDSEGSMLGSAPAFKVYVV